MRLPLLAALCASLILLSSAGRADAPVPGTAAGELTVGGESTALQHVYAIEIDDVEGIRMPGHPKKSLALRFTDNPVSAADAGSTWRIAELARQGKVRAVEVDMDPASGQIFGGVLYYAKTPDKNPILSITLMNSPVYVLEELKVEPDTVSGKALMSKEDEWPELDPNAKPMTYRYSVTFSAPIIHPPKVTATLTGVQARNSPQVRAQLAFEAACRKGDLAAAKRLCTPAVFSNWDMLIAKVGAAEFKKELRTELPEPAVRLKQISKVVVRGDHATVLFKERGGTGIQPVARKNGVWLVDGS